MVSGRIWGMFNIRGIYGNLYPTYLYIFTVYPTEQFQSFTMFWKIRRPLLSLDPQRHVAFQWPGSAQQLKTQTLSTQLLEVEEPSWWQPTNMEIEAETNGDMIFTKIASIGFILKSYKN